MFEADDPLLAECGAKVLARGGRFMLVHRQQAKQEVPQSVSQLVFAAWCSSRRRRGRPPPSFLPCLPDGGWALLLAGHVLAVLAESQCAPRLRRHVDALSPGVACIVVHDSWPGSCCSW